MKLKELINIKLGRLYDLRLADVHILQGVDAPSGLLDLSAYRLRHKLLYELLQVARRRFTVHDLEHFLSDLPNLCRLRVCRLPDLVRATLGERDSEETDEIAIGRLNINVSFDQGLPLADERAELV